MATLIATPGAVNANSYLTLLEAEAYFETRLHYAVWEASEDKERALMMATRVLNAMAQPFRAYIPAGGSVSAYYFTRKQWTGTPSTTTQKLAWPRTGMFDLNGNAIATNVVPQELKDATAELALQLLSADRTLDNEISVQGITSLKAGSVSLSFKDMIEAKVLPDAVWNLMPPSWFTAEVIEYVSGAIFEVI